MKKRKKKKRKEKEERRKKVEGEIYRKTAVKLVKYVQKGTKINSVTEPKLFGSAPALVFINLAPDLNFDTKKNFELTFFIKKSYTFW